jgi:hypothetical protein
MPDNYTNRPIIPIVPSGSVSHFAADDQTSDNQTSDEPSPTFDLSIFVEPQGILFLFQCEGQSEQWTVPKTIVRRAHKAMTIDHVFDLLGAGPIIGYQLREAVTNEPEFLMVPRAVNTLTDRVTKALRRVEKARKCRAAAEESTQS